jgi:hypothetical protein
MSKHALRGHAHAGETPAVQVEGLRSAMDKKSKKKLAIINQRLQVLRQKLAGARKQDDEPGEVDRLETEIAELETEVQQLKRN